MGKATDLVGNAIDWIKKSGNKLSKKTAPKEYVEGISPTKRNPATNKFESGVYTPPAGETPEGMAEGYYKKANPTKFGQKPSSGGMAAKMSGNPINSLPSVAGKAATAYGVGTSLSNMFQDIQDEKMARKPEANRSSAGSQPKNTYIESAGRKDTSKTLGTVSDSDKAWAKSSAERDFANTRGASQGQKVETKRISEPRKYSHDISSSQEAKIKSQAIEDMKKAKSSGNDTFNNRLKELGE